MIVDHVQAQRHTLLRALSEGGSLKTEIAKSLSFKYWSSFQLGEALQALNSHLVGFSYPRLNPKQLPNGSALLEWGGHDRSFHLPDLTGCAELGSLWAILGILQENTDLCTAALKLANWQLNLLDSHGFPHLGLWSIGNGFSAPCLLGYQELLFTLCYQMTGEAYFGQAAELQKKYLKGKEEELPEKLYALISPKLPYKCRYQMNPFTEEVTLGIAKWADCEMSSICALSGYNSGMGSFHKKKGALLNFGPHVGSLDDLSGFGIERICSMTEKTFSDLTWEKGRSGFLLKGWTKIFALPLWILSSLTLVNKQLKIEIELQEDKPFESLFFVFYLKGQKVVINNRIDIQAYSLSRYQGENFPLTLFDEGEKIYIEPEQPGKMRLIPLAGGDFFWGSHFLLAFEINFPTRAYSWGIK